MVNRKVAGYIVENKDTLYEYQGEDTSLGIWLNESPFKKDLFYQDSKAFTNNANCHNQEAVIIGHQLSGQHIRKCYKSKDETLRL